MGAVWIGREGKVVALECRVRVLVKCLGVVKKRWKKGEDGGYRVWKVVKGEMEDGGTGDH